MKREEDWHPSNRRHSEVLSRERMRTNEEVSRRKRSNDSVYGMIIHFYCSRIVQDEGKMT